MIADELLGTFADHLKDAALQSSRYARRDDGSRRMFGGYNFLMFGDMHQLPPIPATAALFRPPVEKIQKQRVKHWMYSGATGQTH